MHELVTSDPVGKFASLALKHGISLYLTRRTAKTLEKLAEGG